MANIRSYLVELESRLAPSLDAGSLQERLTEAENHLRDRAQEFEEIGLPPMEAEARAVAAFGEPEEYTVDVPPRPTQAPLPRPKAETPKRDIALQLAWSAIGLGLVSMLTVAYSGMMAGCAAAFFIFLGTLFGRTTSLWRLALLSGVTVVGLFPVLLGAYVSVPVSSDYDKWMGVRLRNGRTWQDANHQSALGELRVFDRYRQMVAKGTIPHSPDGRSIGPNRAWPDMGPRHYGYGYGWSSLVEYDSVAKAKAMWLQDGDLLRESLMDNVIETTPVTLVLTPVQQAGRFAAISAVAGVLLMTLLTGAQALGMALRAFFCWLFSRRLAPPPMVGRWESPRQ